VAECKLLRLFNVLQCWVVLQLRGA